EQPAQGVRSGLVIVYTQNAAVRHDGNFSAASSSPRPARPGRVRGDRETHGELTPRSRTGADGRHAAALQLHRPADQRQADAQSWLGVWCPSRQVSRSQKSDVWFLLEVRALYHLHSARRRVAVAVVRGIRSRNLVGYQGTRSERESQTMTLYERLGGVYAIATVIDDFIDRIMDDPRL